MDTGGYLVMLEELWRQKVDQIVVLSMAYHDDVPAETVHALTSRHARTDTVLMNRVMRAHEDLALIEDAIDRIKDGTYGICGSCAQPIGAVWLSLIFFLQFFWSAGNAGFPAAQQTRLVAIAPTLAAATIAMNSSVGY